MNVLKGGCGVHGLVKRKTTGRDFFDCMEAGAFQSGPVFDSAGQERDGVAGSMFQNSVWDFAHEGLGVGFAFTCYNKVYITDCFKEAA